MGLLILSKDFGESRQYQFANKSVQWEPWLVHADRQTDMTKIIGAFCECVNALRNCVRSTVTT